MPARLRRQDANGARFRQLQAGALPGLRPAVRWLRLRLPALLNLRVHAAGASGARAAGRLQSFALQLADVAPAAAACSPGEGPEALRRPDIQGGSAASPVREGPHRCGQRNQNLMEQRRLGRAVLVFEPWCAFNTIARGPQRTTPPQNSRYSGASVNSCARAARTASAENGKAKVVPPYHAFHWSM